MRDAKREDWPRLIAEIGLTPYKLALILGVDPATVRGWIAGSEPKHVHGKAIIAMYIEKAGENLSHDPLNIGSFG